MNNAENFQNLAIEQIKNYNKGKRSSERFNWKEGIYLL